MSDERLITVVPIRFRGDIVLKVKSINGLRDDMIQAINAYKFFLEAMRVLRASGSPRFWSYANGCITVRQGIKKIQQQIERRQP